MSNLCQNCGTDLPEGHNIRLADEVWAAINQQGKLYSLTRNTPEGFNLTFEGALTPVHYLGKSEKSTPNGYDGDWDQGHEEAVWVAFRINGQAYLLHGVMNSYGDDTWNGVRLAKQVTKTVTVWE